MVINLLFSWIISDLLGHIILSTMRKREHGYNYDGETVFSRVRSDAPGPDDETLDREFFVYVMGPYTAFNAECAYDNADKLRTRFADDPLFDPDEHVTDDGRGDYEAVLQAFCSQLRERLGVRAFLATDIDIPTLDESDGSTPGMAVPRQSVAFAAVSDAVVFVFTEGGLTTGAGGELGTILGEFNLAPDDPEQVRKPRERFCVFQSEGFESGTIEEIPPAYEIESVPFANREGLVEATQQFLVNLKRDHPDRQLPIYRPYDG